MATKARNATGGGDTDAVEALRELGGAMRARRHHLGLTLSEVAEGTGLSVPFLSQIETSFATPSLTSLFAIARVLETTPERLLAGPGPAEVVLTRSGQGQLYAVTDAALPARRRQLTGLGDPFSVAEYEAEPGSDLGQFFASHGRELLHVTSGCLIVDILDGDGGDNGGRVISHELNAGDTLVYPTSVRHRWRHAGPNLTRFTHVVGATS